MDYKEAQELIKRYKMLPLGVKLSPDEKTQWRTARIVIEDAIADGYELCKREEVHAQGFVDGVKACIEKLGKIGGNNGQ